MATPDLTSAIETAAGNPASTTVDGLAVNARPVAELIAADRYVKASAAAKQVKRGLRFTKLIMPAQCPADPTLNSDSIGGF